MFGFISCHGYAFSVIETFMRFHLNLESVEITGVTTGFKTFFRWYFAIFENVIK